MTRATTAMGVLCWLPDLARWAQVAARLVKPGGIFYVFDSHPLLSMFAGHRGAAAQGAGLSHLRVTHPYFPRPDGLRFKGGQPSYTGGEPIAADTHEWPHSVSEVIGAVQDAGLALRRFHEFPVNCHRALPGMRQDDDGYWRFPPPHNLLPQTFSLLAEKPA